MPLPSSVDGVFSATNKSTTNNLTGISVNGAASAPGDFAITMAGGFSFSGGDGQAPDVSWAAVGAAFYKQLAAGPLTVAQAVSGGNFTVAQLLVLLKTIPGKSPAWTLHGTGSGGSVLVPNAAFTPAAGSSLVWACVTVNQFPNTTSFALDGGLNWSLLANIGIDDGQTHPISQMMWYTENCPASPLSSANLKLNVGNGGTWFLGELSNILAGAGGPRLLLSLGVGL